MGLMRKGYKEMFERNKWKILRGDKVMIMVGKDRGQVGTVTKVIRDEKFPRVMVEGLNLSKRHIKRTKDNPGGIVSVESPLHYSNVSLIDPVTNSPIKVSFRFLEDGTKVRMSRGRLASGSIVPRPEILKQRRKPLPAAPGPLDTSPAHADKITHTPGDLPSALKHMLQQQREFSSGSGGGFHSDMTRGLCARRLFGGMYTKNCIRNQQWRSFASSLF